jgi:cell wall-associated NlpC family hydrolase
MDLQLHDLFNAQFVRGGRDAKTGLDCQGLLLKVLERFGISIKGTSISSYATEVVSNVINEEFHTIKWIKIEQPEEGCVIAMALDPMQPDKVQHLGVYIGEGKFIHILEKHGVLTSRISDRFFKGKFRGFYKWKNQ